MSNPKKSTLQLPRWAAGTSNYIKNIGRYISRTALKGLPRTVSFVGAAANIPFSLTPVSPNNPRARITFSRGPWSDLYDYTDRQKHPGERFYRWRKSGEGEYNKLIDDMVPATYVGDPSMAKVWRNQSEKFGTAGFSILGSYLVPELLGKAHHVFDAVKFSSKLPANLLKKPYVSADNIGFGLMAAPNLDMNKFNTRILR